MVVLVLASVATGFTYAHARHAHPLVTVQAAAAPHKRPAVCNGTMERHEIIISISEQHLWACSQSTQVYQSAVTTGAYQTAGDATPVGVWHIYAKQTNLYLDGSDSQGSWHDFVAYWMPFYQDYGFHDASWQTFPFGDTHQYAAQGSHGCVHLPIKTAAWLYTWAPIGTTVRVQS